MKLLTRVMAIACALLSSACIAGQKAECLDQSDVPQSGSVLEDVLSDARRRANRDCGDARAECRFSVSVGDHGRLFVGVERAERDPQSGECLYAIGDHWMEVYSRSGQYVETVLGL